MVLLIWLRLISRFLRLELNFAESCGYAHLRQVDQNSSQVSRNVPRLSGHCPLPKLCIMVSEIPAMKSCHKSSRLDRCQIASSARKLKLQLHPSMLNK